MSEGYKTPNLGGLQAGRRRHRRPRSDVTPKHVDLTLGAPASLEIYVAADRSLTNATKVAEATDARVPSDSTFHRIDRRQAVPHRLVLNLQSGRRVLPRRARRGLRPRLIMDGPLRELDDQALMRAHQGGDPDAFGEIFRRHRDRMWAVAMQSARRSRAGRRLRQDAFISAYRHAAGYRGDAA
jgi:hypothetical protein